MSEVNALEKTSLGDELRDRLVGLAMASERIVEHSGLMLEVLNFEGLPDPVLRQIEGILRPFAAAMRDLKLEGVALGEFVDRAKAEIARHRRGFGDEVVFDKPVAAKVVN